MEHRAIAPDGHAIGRACGNVGRSIEHLQACGRPDAERVDAPDLSLVVQDQRREGARAHLDDPAQAQHPPRHRAQRSAALLGGVITPVPEIPLAIDRPHPLVLRGQGLDRWKARDDPRSFVVKRFARCELAYGVAAPGENAPIPVGCEGVGTAHHDLLCRAKPGCKEQHREHERV